MLIVKNNGFRNRFRRCSTDLRLKEVKMVWEHFLFCFFMDKLGRNRCNNIVVSLICLLKPVVGKQSYIVNFKLYMKFNTIKISVEHSREF